MKKTLRKGYYWKGKKVDIKPQDVEEKGKKKRRGHKIAHKNQKELRNIQLSHASSLAFH